MFRGSSHDGDYFRLNTLFVLADFLGWLEIIRRDMQFLDLGDVQATHELNKKIGAIQDSLASTTRLWDPNYLYRGQQRAIGEIMTVAIEDAGARGGPRYETIGFAAFCKKMQDPEFAKWFDRFGGQLSSLPDHGSERLAEVQRGLIDLIKVLDPESLRYNIQLDKL